MRKEKISQFVHWLFKPEMGKAYLIRIAVLAVTAFVFFRFFCLPMVLDGASMEPNYHSGTLNFCWAPTYWFRRPSRGDVVVLRYAGERLMLLKRIVAFPGETVEFRDGVLYVDGTPLEEPYIKFKREKWNLKPRKVSTGYYYVVGDNRSMPMEMHKFGEIRQNRVEGTLLL